jgi:nicotinate dehydrogenase subunit B
MKPTTFDPEIEMPAETLPVTRREFLAAGGAGLFVFFVPEVVWSMQERERGTPRPSYPADFNAYLRVGADGRVTCMVGKIEMGQGVMTSLAQMLAGDLDVRLDTVDMIMGDTDQCPWDMGTFGSLSTRMFGPVLRAAAAEARAVLLQLASERLEVPLDTLTAQDGMIRSVAEHKQITYAQLVAGKRIERHIDKTPVKLAAQIKIYGESPARKDATEKVTGKAKYAGDIRLPGMLQARILRPPAHGATLKDADVSAAEKRPGVTVIRDGDLIAVLHEHRDQAESALALIKANFAPAPAGLNDETIFAHLVKNAPTPRVVHESGSLADGEKLSTGVIEQSYLNSYVAHAPMETHTATAQIVDGKLTVWASTQTPFPLKQQLMQTLALPADKVRVITPYVGGGFGGKSAGLQSIEAARLAKLTGKPVQVVWDRSEEFFYDTFRPAAVVKVRSGTDKAGKIVLWQFNIYGAGERGAAILRSAASADDFGRRLGRRQSRRILPPGGRAVARAVGQHQHLRARIAHRHHGGQARRRSRRVPYEQSHQPAHAHGARGRSQTVRMEARQRSQRTRRRRGSRHRLRRVCRHHRRSCGRQGERQGPGEASGLRAGAGRHHQSRRHAAAA